jgi:hypothetical protein
VVEWGGVNASQVAFTGQTPRPQDLFHPDEFILRAIKNPAWAGFFDGAVRDYSSP